MTILEIILTVALAVVLGLWWWSDADYDTEYQAHGKTLGQLKQTSKDYLRCAQALLRSEQENAALREDNANLEAHIRRQGLFVVGADDPLPVVPADPAARIALGIAAAREAASLDAEWAEINHPDQNGNRHA